MTPTSSTIARFALALLLLAGHAPGVGPVLEIDVAGGNVRNELVKVTGHEHGRESSDDDGRHGPGRGRGRYSSDRDGSRAAALRP